MSTKLRKFVYLFLMLLLSVFVSFSIVLFNNKKTGYISTMKVYEEFKLKKELEFKMKDIQIKKQAILDSLRFKIQTIQIRYEEGDKSLALEVENLKKEFLLKENQFNNEHDALYESFSAQIWNQLNQYVEDYGKEFNYDYLYGATGQGNLMYANKTDDVTEKVIQYINNKYEGK